MSSSKAMTIWEASTRRNAFAPPSPTRGCREPSLGGGRPVNDTFDGVRLVDAGERDARYRRGLSREAALSLAQNGQVAYRVLDASTAVPGATVRGSELRVDARRR